MDILRARIKSHEGLVLHPYKDSEGHWTVGVGHKIPTPVLPEDFGIHKIHEWFEQDIHHASDCLMSCDFIVVLNQTRRRVCVELIFWVGFRGFKRFRKMIRAIRRRDFKLAALELYHSELGATYSTRTKKLSVLMWEGHETKEAVA